MAAAAEAAAQAAEEAAQAAARPAANGSRPSTLEGSGGHKEQLGGLSRVSGNRASYMQAVHRCNRST